MLNTLRVHLGRWRQLMKERVLWTRAGKPLRAGLLLEEPPVLYVKFNEAAWEVQLAALKGNFQQPGLLLVGFLWLQNDRTVRWMQEIAARLPRVLPAWEMVILCNSAPEVALYDGTGLRAVLFSQNALLDEQIYTVQPEVKKEFDALYDGQLIRFKRHHLAAGVRSLALISYKYDMNYDAGYGRQVVEDFRHATWINNPIAPDYRKLSDREVAREYNRARVGLCLSEEEGSMYASCQYLLCGLPLVSTRSRGGRDVMYSPEDCLVVADRADAVAAGVQEALSRALPPEQVRARVLEKMREHRRVLIGVVQDYLNRRGVALSYADVFRSHFTNKLLAVRPLDQLKPFPVVAAESAAARLV